MSPDGMTHAERGDHAVDVGQIDARTRYRLTGTIQVALPPAEALHLFTPEGEREWVAGWDPQFPARADDDVEPGAVFTTSAHGETTIWVVVDREVGKRVTYARVTPDSRAGTVSVVLDETGTDLSSATVIYDLTALTAAADDELRSFAAHYSQFMRSWEEAIAGALAR